MAEALRKSGCRVEVRSYKGTAHGWGLAAGTPANGWLTQAIDFWQS